MTGLPVGGCAMVSSPYSKLGMWWPFLFFDADEYGSPSRGEMGHSTLPLRLIKPRLYLFAEELQRFHDAVVRDFGAAIHLGKDAIEADFLS